MQVVSKGPCGGHFHCLSLVLLALRTISAAVPVYPGSRYSHEVVQQWQHELHKRSSDAGGPGPVNGRDQDNDGDFDFDGNCSNIRDVPNALYNNSCQVVQAECEGTYELFNYLQFVTCDLGTVSGRPANDGYRFY